VIRKKLLSLPILLLFVLSVISVNMTGVSAGVYPAIYVDPPETVSPDSTVGTLYTVAIETDYIGTDPYSDYITSYQFTLSYDPNILYGVEVTNGDLIVGGSFIQGPFDNVAGELSLTVAFYDPGVVTSGPGTLAYVTFKVVGYGTSDITIGSRTKLIGWNWFEEPHDYYIIDAETMPDHIQHGYFDNTRVAPPGTPVAVITAPETGYVNEPVTFSGADSYPDGGTIIKYHWYFRDGLPPVETSEPTIDHTFTTIGIYTVSLVVTDDENKVSDSAYHTIEITIRLVYAADLVRWKVKPEKSTWDYSKDEDKLVNITALARNLGNVPVNIKITFVIIDAETATPAGDPIVATTTLKVPTILPGETYDPTQDVPIFVYLNPYLYGYDGKTRQILYAHTTLRYDSDANGTYDTATKPKTIKFVVVP